MDRVRLISRGFGIGRKRIVGPEIWNPARQARAIVRPGKCILFAEMGLQNCRTCQYLIENVTVASNRHWGVQSLLKSAVKNVREDTNIFSLLQLNDSCELERREALDQYRIHLLGHQTNGTITKVRAAAS